MARDIVVAMTGASGAGYAVELLRAMANLQGIKVRLIHNRGSREILRKECQMDIEDLSPLVEEAVPSESMDHGLASGSNLFESMVVCPCTASTASKIALGIADNLTTRTAAVALKERRDLIIVLRETPLSTAILGNLRDLSSMGAVIMPASPPFYGLPSTVQEVQRTIAGRILGLLNVENGLAPRYAP